MGVLEDDKWQAQQFLPNLSAYTQEPDELVGGTMCNKYTLYATHGSTGVMNDAISFYWDPVLSKPVRWHQHARGLPFGSHTDEYILDYLSFQAVAPSETDMALPDSSCKQPVTASVAVGASTLVGALNQDMHATKTTRLVELLNRQHAGSTRFAETGHALTRFQGGKRKGSSLLRRTEEHRQYVGVHALTKKPLPKDFDWRTAKPGVVGPVKDQAMCGSCWTYGAIGPVESIKAIQTGELVTLPEQFMLDCAWTNGTGASAGNFGCDGVTLILACLRLFVSLEVSFQLRLHTAAIWPLMGIAKTFDQWKSERKLVDGRTFLRVMRTPSWTHSWQMVQFP